MNLIAPPVRRFLAWSLRNKAAAVNYIKAMFQLSRLTVTVTYGGRRRKFVVTYTGRDAKVDIPLDWIAQ